MQSIFNKRKVNHKLNFLFSISQKTVLFCALLMASIQIPVQAQESTYTNPSWWFGIGAAANINFYRGSTHQMNENLTLPVTFHDGLGVGLYVAPIVEFHRPDSKWGFMLQAGYDNRKGAFDQVMSPCNCPADLNVNLSYISLEPSLRFAPFNTGFYLFGGPRFAYNLEKSFEYQLGTNPDLPDQETNPVVEGDLSHMNQYLTSFQVGAGYDIPLSSLENRSKFVLSPTISVQPYYGQDPRTIETWNITTVRAGVILKYGAGSKTAETARDIYVIDPAEKPKPVVQAIKSNKDAPKTDKIFIAASNDVKFAVHAPKNVPVVRRVRETFPIRNYVFFDLKSSEISDRYILLNKNQVKDFKEDQLEVFLPKKLSGRSDRQMIVYYNILNILGDRMQKNPTSSISLVGSSESGPTDGLAMAESIKRYLVDVFGVQERRIVTSGTDKPKDASEQPGGTLELELLRQCDRRVTINSLSSELMQEFESGQDGMLKPVEFDDVQTAPIESYLTVTADGANKAFSSWSLEITDDKGIAQHYGPFENEIEAISGKAILGTRSEGIYNVKMIGLRNNGETVQMDTTVQMVLWTPPANEQGMRFSVLFKFNNSESIKIYDKYLTEVVSPKIPQGGTVLIHGYSDIIGDAANNLRLSQSRANDVKRIIEEALLKANRKDVRFEVFGFGEVQSVAPFGNEYPEERFYNRTVIIDILPGK
jgi:outer membrane protein OmpA-like peptidoglycan-associated protein